MRIQSFFIAICLLACAATVHGQAPVGYDFDQGAHHDISKSVEIFPNPAVEFIHVRLEHVNIDNVKVSLHNIIGNEINIDTERINEHELRIRVKDFDAGYYLLALRDDQAKFRGTYKFLKR